MLFFDKPYFRPALLAFLLSMTSASWGQSAPTAAKPNPGEGVFAFLSRNGLDPSKHLTAFVELNNGKFGKDNGLLSHRTYLLPTTSSGIVEPLLGEAFKEIAFKNNELAGAVFYLISGHGGPDPGASGKYGNTRLDEDEYAYDITLRLGRCLLEKGARVYFLVQDPNDGIRDQKILAYDNDETCMDEAIPLSQVDRLRQRVNKTNQLFRENTQISYQRTVSIHLDSRSQNKQIDVFFYHHEESRAGQQLAETLRSVFDEKYRQHQPSRGFSGTVSTRNLYELKYTFPVSVFIELGNIQNQRDQQRFILPGNRQTLALWLAEGLTRDYQSKNGTTAIKLPPGREATTTVKSPTNKKTTNP